MNSRPAMLAAAGASIETRTLLELKRLYFVKFYFLGRMVMTIIGFITGELVCI